MYALDTILFQMEVQQLKIYIVDLEKKYSFCIWKLKCSKIDNLIFYKH